MHISQLELASVTAVGVFFAPQSGDEIRRRIANKCFDTIDSANDKVWQSRLQVRDVVNKGQQEIIKVVAAGRAAVAKPKTAETPVAIL
ncbi:MAG TPA: YtxH domain-containing protein [Candidatus Acidoferrales bacterium]|nr:YtxH domain-containing protein [Candidatus Acidoferrales bacterium]